MEPRPSTPLRSRRPRREQLLTNLGLLLVVLCGMLGAGVYLGTRVAQVLPDVGKNLSPADPWGAPIAVERTKSGKLVAHLPPCAQSAISGLFLWTDQNKPLWEVRGQAFPIEDFEVGTVPPGLKTVHALQRPSRNEVLLLGVLRPSGRPAGVTFRVKNLRAGEVRYGKKWLSVDEFRRLAKCPTVAAAKRSARSSSNTLPAQTVPATTSPPPTFGSAP